MIIDNLKPTEEEGQDNRTCNGTGKKLITIAVMHSIFTADVMAKQCLVLCPLVVANTWEDDVGKWTHNLQHELPTYNVTKDRDGKKIGINYGMEK